MTDRPRALVLRSPGANCDAEMARAFELAGANAELVHVDALVGDPQRMGSYDLLGFPGGFSYGDDVASGRVLALRLRERLAEPLRAAAERGVPMIGVCNGFQTLVQTGLLPGPSGADGCGGRTVALAENSGARFLDRWVGVEVVPESRCVWTADLWSQDEGARHAQQLPIAHGQGRFVTASSGVLSSLQANGQVAMRYSTDVNGSAAQVAGVCDATGRIFGLMPHPERYTEWRQHPYWTRLPASVRGAETPGLRMFRNAVVAAGVMSA